MASMVASVGPYRLCTSARQSRATRAARDRGRGSPPQRTARRVVGVSSGPVSVRTTERCEGTNWAMVAPASRIRASSPAGSWLTAGGTGQVEPPCSSGSQVSQTEASKLGEVRARTRSSSVRPRWPAIHAMWLVRAEWVTTTPLGRPVEPEV